MVIKRIFTKKLLIFLSLITTCGTAIAEDKLSCPFTSTTDSLAQLKDEMTRFSFQLIEQDTPAKTTTCQNYMNTLNTAREAYTNVLRSRSAAEASLAASNAKTSTPEMIALDAQIKMSNAVQGMMTSQCRVDDNQALGATALNTIDSIAGTITLAGLVDARALLLGVSLSAITRLGVTLANWLIPHSETNREHLASSIKNDAFLDRLCLFRRLAYKIDEINPSILDFPELERKATEGLHLNHLSFYRDQGLSCFLGMEQAQAEFNRLGADLNQILAETRELSAADKCSQYIYALEENSKGTQRLRIGLLYDVVWRIGCDDIGIDLSPKESQPDPAHSGSPKPSEAATQSAPVMFELWSVPATPGRRIHDYCKHWRSLMDTIQEVDCFSGDTKKIESFNSTVKFLFNHAATVGEAALTRAKEENPDLYKTYRQLKSQRDLLQFQLQRFNEMKKDQSTNLAQTEGMLTNLGNIILGDGLKQYANWNQNEIKTTLGKAIDRLNQAKSGSPQQKCSAAQFAAQRLRQVEPRSDTMKKVCDLLGGNGKTPRPPFNDPTRTFASITDIKEAPLETMCNEDYTNPPPELAEIRKMTSENLKHCSAHSP